MRADVEMDTVVIEVEDDGIGIAAEELPRLFHMFSQLQDGTSRAEGGLGVGLALVKGLVDLHGGSVSVSSPGPGGGSRFSIRLPLVTLAAEPGVQAVQPEGSTIAPANTRRVLVVDDNVDAAESLAVLLDLLGDEVRVAHGGKEALQIAGDFRPHVAVLDIGMAGMDGYALATALRAQPWGQYLALVAVTGWGQDADRERASRAGFHAHFTKPVEPQQLRAAIVRLAAMAGPTEPAPTSALADQR
ncbi:MAG: hypothetical protein NVS2B4_09080 [Ramlibacter sp.]